MHAPQHPDALPPAGRAPGAEQASERTPCTADAADARDCAGASPDCAAPSGLNARPWWQRALWLGAGVCSVALGVIGAFLPLLPTVPFMILAAFCFARSSTRCERWLLQHPRYGPLLQRWRARRAIPRRVKQLAWTMMAIGSALAAWMLPAGVAWLPAACCLVVALWMARLPEA